jgi:ABC-type transport system involved in multi-copper enzyme maturation permease subunit
MKPQYKALILDTILKEARSKTLIFIFVATTLAIIMGHLVLSMINTQIGGDQTVSFSGISALTINFRILNSISFIVAAIFGVSIFRSDFQNNIIYQYLSFPIARTEYFFIRVLGTWILVLGYYLYSYVLSAVLFSFAFKKIVFTSAHIYGFFILSIYLLLVIFIAIFFSLLMNKIGALITTFTLAIFSAGSYATFSKLPYNEFFQGMNAFKGVGLVLYSFFPRMAFLSDTSNNLLFSEPIPVNLWEQIAHLVIVSGIYVFLANYLVKKRDF